MPWKFYTWTEILARLWRRAVTWPRWATVLFYTSHLRRLRLEKNSYFATATTNAICLRTRLVRLVPTFSQIHGLELQLGNSVECDRLFIVSNSLDMMWFIWLGGWALLFLYGIIYDMQTPFRLISCSSLNDKTNKGMILDNFQADYSQ